MKKLIIHTNDYSAGWSTAVADRTTARRMLLDQEIADLIQQDQISGTRAALDRYPDMDYGDSVELPDYHLTTTEVYTGQVVTVHVSDGLETVEIQDGDNIYEIS